ALSLDKQTGYLGTALGKKGGYKRVHELVALTFIGERPKGQVTRHLDGDKLNNRPGNLMYGTEKENQSDRLMHGTSY
ncbi:HNH endonuclease signature motif containing protein, partial [Vibrio parahaemolyticus]|uniref:HNH endonuclease signature motif containing protein n=2 Tax=Vibrio TaxID=662 RepID=UPI0015DFD48C